MAVYAEPSQPNIRARSSVADHPVAPLQLPPIAEIGRAYLGRDASYDGLSFVGVRTTVIRVALAAVGAAGLASGQRIRNVHCFSGRKPLAVSAMQWRKEPDDSSVVPFPSSHNRGLAPWLAA